MRDLTQREEKENKRPEKKKKKSRSRGGGFSDSDEGGSDWGDRGGGSEDENAYDLNDSFINDNEGSP